MKHPGRPFQNASLIGLPRRRELGLPIACGVKIELLNAAPKALQSTVSLHLKPWPIRGLGNQCSGWWPAIS